MSRKKLPQEIVSLIHHVELSQGGWWKKAVGQITKGLLWRAGRPLSVDEVIECFRTEIGYQMTIPQLEQQIQLLISVGEVSRMPDGKLKISEASKERLGADVAAANAQQDECKRLFIEDVSEFCPGLNAEEVWGEFSAVLGKVISTHGANAFHLLVDGRIQKESDWIEKYIESKPEHKGGLNVAIRNLFDPSREACRAQILRLISANFFAEASQLSQATLDVLESKRKGASIKILLDTNFIFSLLNLHENPANDSAASLLDLAEKHKAVIDIRFYVLPGTLAEATSTLEYHLEKIKSIRITRAMHRAIRSYPFSGIETRYFEAASSTPGLTPEAFLMPYIDGLSAILRQKGVLVLEEQTEAWSLRQSVIDDLVEEEKYEERLPENKRKGHKSILHDVVFWHVVKSRRSKNTDSPLDIDYWGTTADWRLIDFDQRKRSHEEPIPVVLYPTNLIQLLQFWVPRSELLEASLIESFRLPLFFTRFDSEDEAATLNVLRVMSRYENLDDLTEDTVSSILANKVLKNRLMEATKGNEEEIQLIREFLLEEMKADRERLEKARLEIERVSGRAIEAEKAVGDAAEKLRERETELQRLASSFGEAEVRSRDAESMLELERAKGSELSEKVEELRRQGELKDARLTYLVASFFIIAVSAGLAWWVANKFPILSRLFGSAVAYTTLFFIAFMSFHFIYELVVKGRPAMESLKIFSILQRFRAIIWTLVGVWLVGGICSALLGNYVQKRVDEEQDMDKKSPVAIKAELRAKEEISSVKKP